MIDDLDEMADAELRVLALAMMGQSYAPDLLGTDFEPPGIPDPATNVADAMALAEAMRARGWWVNLESPCAWAGKTGKLWRCHMGRTEHSWTDASAGSDTPARAITLACVRASRAGVE